jgi:hypothetical protein
MSEIKFPLATLERFVSEFKAVIANAEHIVNNATPDNKLDYLVELAKASGLASNIAGEAVLLVQDIQFLISGSPAGVAKADMKSALDLTNPLSGLSKGNHNKNN